MKSKRKENLLKILSIWLGLSGLVGVYGAMPLLENPSSETLLLSRIEGQLILVQSYSTEVRAKLAESQRQLTDVKVDDPEQTEGHLDKCQFVLHTVQESIARNCDQLKEAWTL